MSSMCLCDVTVVVAHLKKRRIIIGWFSKIISLKSTEIQMLLGCPCNVEDELPIQRKTDFSVIDEE